MDKNIWDTIHNKYTDKKVYSDNWMDKYLKDLDKESFILDLGCGLGNDTKELLDLGYKVFSSDYSQVALEYVKNKFRRASVVNFDMRSHFPFSSKSFDMIVADLSLHYFSSEETIKVMKEIKRVLKENGILIARVNSINDINYGSLSKDIIEKHYFMVDGYNKRFFDNEDIKKYFSYAGKILSINETELHRYEKTKYVYEVEVKK